MSPVGWKDHTHVCSACDNIYACDGTHSCPICEPYLRAVEENEAAMKVANHTHPCADCQTPVDCDGDCEVQMLCESCTKHQEAVEANEREALRVYRRFGDDDEPIRFGR